MGTSKGAKRRVKSLERKEKAIELRLAGHTYAEIARRLECSTSQAHRLLLAGLEDSKERVSDKAVHFREIQQRRIERLVLALWEDAIDGDRGAIDRLVRLFDRQARLWGMDAPKMVDATVAHLGLADPENAKDEILARLAIFGAK